MTRVTSRAALALGIGLTAGCATIKTGSGFTLPGTTSVRFNWASAGNVAGSMTATLANGETFKGRFFQTTSSLTDELGPQGPTWHQEGPYDLGPKLQYIAHYTGRVVADLSRADGEQMRCRFELIKPDDGMAGMTMKP